MTEIVFRLKRHLTSFQIMILGFAGVILLGALVLMLPIATVQRVWTPFHEALFTSTSAVCVTGLVVQDTGSYWSAFGQTVILLLIQIGGLGVITGAVTFLMLAGRNITLKERSAMQDAISAPAVGGIVRLTRFILKGTFLVELLGALALLPVFCRDYGLRGVWMSVFHSVSAFCNAGFDILGRTDSLYPSLTAYAADPLVNIVIMLLIIVGGDHRGRHRLSNVGRCLYARSAPAALPDAEQGHSERDGAFDHDSGGPLLSDGLCGPPRGRADIGLPFSVGHAADGRL